MIERDNVIFQVCNIRNIDLVSKKATHLFLTTQRSISTQTKFFSYASYQFFLLTSSVTGLCSTSLNTSPFITYTTKNSGLIKTTSLLSHELLLWSNSQDSTSGFLINLLGQQQRTKLNLARYNNHYACPQLSFLAIMKYSRFLQFVQIFIGFTCTFQKVLTFF